MGHGSGKREAYLRDNTRDAVQALVNQLWTLPSHPSEDGTTLVADLPDPVFVIPREKPVCSATTSVQTNLTV